MRAHGMAARAYGLRCVVQIDVRSSNVPGGGECERRLAYAGGPHDQHERHRHGIYLAPRTGCRIARPATLAEATVQASPNYGLPQ